MNILIKYVLLSIICTYNLYPLNQTRALKIADEGMAQNAIFIKSATDITHSTDGVFLHAADIAALEFETIQNLFWLGSSELCTDQGVAKINLSRFFETPNQVTTFISSINQTSYSGEPFDIVKRILMASDFLLISQQKLKTYIQSIAEQVPLLLYRLYKDDTMRLGAENWRLIRNQLASLSPFKLQQRLVAIDNRNPAVGHTGLISSIAKLDEDTVITGSTDCTAILWHKNSDGVWQSQQHLGVTGNQNPTLGHTRYINSIIKLDDDTVLTGSSDCTAIIWHKNADSAWQIHQRLGVASNQNAALGHINAIHSIAKLNDNTVITGSHDHTSILWHKNADGVWQFQQRSGVVNNQNPAVGHIRTITSIIKLNEDTVITGSEDYTAIVWHKDADGVWQLHRRFGVVDNQNQAVGHIRTITSIAKLDDDTIITGSHDRTAILWHKNTDGMWQLQQRLGIVDNENQALGHIYAISSITKLDDNTVITGSYDHTAILWHKNAANIWQLQQRFGLIDNQDPALGHTRTITSIAKLDDDTIITGSYDQTAILWRRNIDRHFEPMLQPRQALGRRRAMRRCAVM